MSNGWHFKKGHLFSTYSSVPGTRSNVHAKIQNDFLSLTTKRVLVPAVPPVVVVVVVVVA